MNHADTPDELPTGLKEPLMRLWRIEQPILARIKPRDAWIAVGIIQFASRHPGISPTQRQLMVSFGRELQRTLAAIEPEIEQYLEMGWNPAHDVPRQRRR